MTTYLVDYYRYILSENVKGWKQLLLILCYLLYVYCRYYLHTYLSNYLPMYLEALFGKRHVPILWN